MSIIKNQLLEQCKKFVANKLQTIENTIKSNQQALLSETKSSAGDKHETGRAMLQLEMEKAGQQLNVVAQMQETLNRVDISKKSPKIGLGTLVITSGNNYFLAISLGKVILKETTYFVLSTHSPIGKLLLGKQTGDSIKWDSKTILIDKVI